MDLARSAELADFREQARAWLAENVPVDDRPAMPGPEVRVYDAGWQRVQYDGGWAGINWPSKYGGRGLPLLEQVVWYEELVRAHAPRAGIFGVALSHAGPTVMAAGTEAQKAFHLPRILNGATPWCQGFSEPEAGSDLASLRCRAEIDGSDLVVTGSKIWTSYAEHADYCELLVRTDPAAERHRGLSWVIMDMHLPGIEVRPILSMDGWPHNCAVFFDEVRIPVANVVGGVNDGWKVAMTTLAAERGPGFLDERLSVLVFVDDLIEHARSNGRLHDDGVRAQLAELRAEAAAVRSMAYFQVSRQMVETEPAADAVATRSFYVQLQMRAAQVAMSVLGPEALGLSEWTSTWLEAFSGPIAGGTIDVQKNIIGERVLGLAR